MRFTHIIFLGLVLGSPLASAEVCSPSRLNELLEPATAARPAFRLDCEATLRRSDVITKRILVAGAKSSGARLLCNGATINGRPGTLNAGKKMISISSEKIGGRWERPTDVEISGCVVHGNVRLYGMVADFDDLKASSRKVGHTARAQAAAPTRIKLSGLTIVGYDGNMLFIGIGSTRVSVLNSRFIGKAGDAGSAIYLEAETSANELRGNEFDVKTGRREIIAVDGSANNVIAGNVFRRTENGAIFLYRNCGEGGVVRHQTPSGNKIDGNKFYASLDLDEDVPTIHVSSRKGGKSYCGQDKGFPFGSSSDDGSHAINNAVINNEFVDRSLASAIKVSEQPNTVAKNKVTLTRPIGTVKKNCFLAVNAKNRLVVRAPDGRGLAYFGRDDYFLANMSLKAFRLAGYCD